VGLETDARAGRERRGQRGALLGHGRTDLDPGGDTGRRELLAGLGAVAAVGREQSPSSVTSSIAELPVKPVR